MVVIALLAELLALGCAKSDANAKRKEWEKAQGRYTNTNRELQEKYLSEYFKEVEKKDKEYLDAGYTKEQALTYIYRDFGIPMQKDVHDPFLKTVVVGKDNIYRCAMLMTKRKLASLGYAWAYDKGTPEEERKKSLQTYKNDKAKYPWL